jgi:hypothetical protein
MRVADFIPWVTGMGTPLRGARPAVEVSNAVVWSSASVRLV